MQINFHVDIYQQMLIVFDLVSYNICWFVDFKMQN